MGFQQGLSGLNSASKQLDVIGNNVANSNAAGFKGSVAQFSDVFANSLSGSGGTQIGIGSRLAAVSQQFSQGNVSVTNNPLDVAINGRGFFRMEDVDGSITYSRNGQFLVDKVGQIVNGNGLRLTGYAADANGDIVPAAPVPLVISTSDLPPRVSANVDAVLNLDSRSTVPTVGTFDPTDPSSYTSSTSVTVYDTLGNDHVLSMYFAKTAAAGGWNLFATLDGTGTNRVNLGGGAGVAAGLSFNASGVLTTAMPLTATVDLAGVATDLGSTNGAVSPLAVDLNFLGSTSFGAIFGVNSLLQDGYTSGRISGVNIAGDGVVQGRYTNGQSLALGQVVLANFVNPQGLQPMGRSQWAETSDSGQPLVGAPGSSSLGLLQSSAVEEANVDLTAELVNMINAQRAYQANAQTIKTQDAILQTLVNLR